MSVDDAKALAEASREHAASLADRLRLPLPQAPEAPLRFPSNVAHLSESDLGEQLAYWSSMASYARYQVAILDAAHVKAEDEALQEYDARYAGRSEEHVTDKRHLAGASKAVRGKRRRAALLRSDLVVLRSLLDGYERKYNAVSRELSRRHSERTMDRGT